MSQIIEVADLCHQVSLSLSGRVNWGESVPYDGPGTYVIVAPELSPEQTIVYIGRATRLRRRLRQFYRHVYGNPSPHRGGQEILNIAGPKIVYWAIADDYANAEDSLLKAFERMAGTKPMGNKFSSARIRQG